LWNALFEFICAVGRCQYPTATSLSRPGNGSAAKDRHRGRSFDPCSFSTLFRDAYYYFGLPDFIDEFNQSFGGVISANSDPQ